MVCDSEAAGQGAAQKSAFLTDDRVLRPDLEEQSLKAHHATQTSLCPSCKAAELCAATRDQPGMSTQGLCPHRVSQRHCPDHQLLSAPIKEGIIRGLIPSDE